MLRAGMPEAAVDEDGESRPGEHDVAPPTGHPREGMIDTESQTLPVEQAAESDLWGGVPSSLPRHPRGNRATGWWDPRRTVVVEVKSVPSWGSFEVLRATPARIRCRDHPSGPFLVAADG